MAFEEIIGQKRVIDILNKVLESGRLPHALLFHGPDGVGKLALALAMAKAQFCREDPIYCDRCSDCLRVSHLNHPDLKIIFPAKKNYDVEDAKVVLESIIQNPYNYLRNWQNEEILIDIIRKEVRRWVSLKSLEKRGKAIIFLDAHRFRDAAANALLKIMEEPPEGVTLFLLTAKPDLLLPTIISRCHQVRFDPIPWQEIKKALIEREKVSEGQAAVVARMSFGSYRRALELLSEDISERQNLMLDMLRKVLMSDLEILTFAENLSNKENAKGLVEILELMTVWFRDAMVLEKMENDSKVSDKLIFSDQRETLEKFVKSFEKIPHEKILEDIERAITMINQNVSLQLVILNLIYELKKQLRRRLNV